MYGGDIWTFALRQEGRKEATVEGSSNSTPTRALLCMHLQPISPDHHFAIDTIDAEVVKEIHTVTSSSRKDRPQ